VETKNTGVKEIDIIDVQPSGEFDEEILADLISEGYTGKELLERFKKMRRAIRPAVEAMLADIEAAVESGEYEYCTTDELFSDYDEDDGDGTEEGEK
jgi:hypothetical protein